MKVVLTLVEVQVSRDQIYSKRDLNVQLPYKLQEDGSMVDNLHVLPTNYLLHNKYTTEQ